jgi:hypothetical protein
MKFNSMTAMQLAWAFVCVPIIFFFFVFIAYRNSLAAGKLPYYGQGDWIWFGVLGALLLSGIACIQAHSTRLRILLMALYAIVMGAAMFAIHIAVACSSGDCF